MHQWECVTSKSAYKESHVLERTELADAARDYDWKRMIEILEKDPSLINVTRLEGSTGYTPLHRCAHGGAPAEIVQKLLNLGAWRTLRTDDGKTALEIATNRGNVHLIPVLEPVLVHQVPEETLEAIQAYFHKVISDRAQFLLDGKSYRLPQVSVLLEMENPRMWCPIPGMYGGFLFWLGDTGTDAKLVSESWCRVAGGSGQRHKVSVRGSELIAAGFVCPQEEDF